MVPVLKQRKPNIIKGKRPSLRIKPIFLEQIALPPYFKKIKKPGLNYIIVNCILMFLFLSMSLV